MVKLKCDGCPMLIEKATPDEEWMIRQVKFWNTIQFHDGDVMDEQAALQSEWVRCRLHNYFLTVYRDDCDWKKLLKQFETFTHGIMALEWQGFNKEVTQGFINSYNKELNGWKIILARYVNQLESKERSVVK